MPADRAFRQLGLFDSDAPLLRAAPERSFPPRELSERAARRLADDLAALLTEPVKLTVHDNRSTMVSFRRRAGSIFYRVHHMFLDAPGDVVKALAAFAGAGRGAGRRRRAAGELIDAYVKVNKARIGPPAEPARLEARGSVHDLGEIFDRLNAEHFGGRIEARIGWGNWRGRTRGRRRTIKTGVYVQDAKLIRVHPALDRADVPEFYVRAVVFHEMLHQAVPAEEVAGRRIVHGPAFRRRERAFADYHRAKVWEEHHLSLLLGARS